MQASFMRIRIIHRLIRMRISVLSYACKNIVHIGSLATKATQPGLHELGNQRQKIYLSKTVLVGATRRIQIYKQTNCMKRIGNLYDEIISIDNLNLADSKARKHKGKSYGVRIHDKNREANILALHESLKNGTFKTSPYHVFTIYEPKERLIFRLPYFPDRILHHAIMNVLEPIWVSIFNKNTYSCIKKRGIHACAKNVRHALKIDPDGTRYCLKIDIRKFYPSIDHSIMKMVIRRKIKDVRLLALLDEIIDSASGVPIGNYLSQYFANLFLAYFDHWLKEEKRVKYYFRYADDIVILAPNKEVLHGLLHEMRSYLCKMDLKVKRNYQVFPVDSRGIDFLGYVFFHSHTKLRKSIKKKLCRRVASLNKKKVVPTKEVYRQQICSWWGWCKYCNSINFVNQLSKKIPYEIKFVKAKRTL